MKLDLDTIQFESRNEIRAIIKALDKWQQEHGKENPDQNKHVERLIDQLDVMDMSW